MLFVFAQVLTCVVFFLFVLHVVCCEVWTAAIFEQETWCVKT